MVFIKIWLLFDLSFQQNVGTREVEQRNIVLASGFKQTSEPVPSVRWLERKDLLLRNRSDGCRRRQGQAGGGGEGEMEEGEGGGEKCFVMRTGSPHCGSSALQVKDKILLGWRSPNWVWYAKGD